MIANIKFDKLLSCFIWEKKSREMFMELYEESIPWIAESTY